MDILSLFLREVKVFAMTRNWYNHKQNPAFEIKMKTKTKKQKKTLKLQLAILQRIHTVTRVSLFSEFVLCRVASLKRGPVHRPVYILLIGPLRSAEIF